ncbi:MAG TPA: chromate transporter [Casimicrobium huifangae]|nr:chromate transporter [Casimicrobium huifangae]HQA33824.1 chromate transporter [Casimicrobium huifangae]
MSSPDQPPGHPPVGAPPSPIPGPAFVPDRWAMFLAFLQIGVSAFGGALPWGRRILVEDRKWISSKEFTEIVTVCQAVPGPNMVNLAVFVGTRYHGIVGALIAFVGIVGVPLAILLALNAVYHSFAHLPAVRSAMTGMAATATAYLLYMSLKMGGGFWRRPLGIALCVASAALAFLAHWHMALVLLVCGAVGVVLSKRGRL